MGPDPSQPQSSRPKASQPKANQLVVPVAEMLRRPGTRRQLAVTIDDGTIDDGTFVGGRHGAGRHEGGGHGEDRLATSDAAVHGPVELQLSLESVINGVEVTGSLSARWRGACRRCLEPIEQPVRQSLREMFSPAPVDGAPVDEEVYPISDGEADLGPMVRDSLVLALPIAPLCSPDCPGPAPDAYPMNQPAPADGERPKDPRWAALDALRTGQ